MLEFLKKKKRKRRGKGGGRKRRREEKGGERVPSLCPIHILPRILNARCIRELICLLAAIASEASKYGSLTSANRYYIAIPEGGLLHSLLCTPACGFNCCIIPPFFPGRRCIRSGVAAGGTFPGRAPPQRVQYPKFALPRFPSHNPSNLGVGFRL